jgi:DNA-binding LacI/PurR family transcriptional regulator
MEAKTVYLLVEPSIMTPIWHANSIEGLKRAAAKQKRTVCQIRSVEELDGQDNPVALVLISTNNDWTSAAIESCRKRNIRPIVIGCMPGKFGEDVSGTMYSSKSSVQEMLQYYVSCGRKRVALMGINENSTNDATKREAFLTAARQLGLPATAKDIYCSNKGAVNTLEAFFDNIDQYDGVMCGNDYMAANVLAWCNDHGIKVPEQLYVSGLGDTLLCRYSNPTLTSATRSYIQTGEQAFNIWKQLNGDPSIFAIVVVVQCEIKPRGSTAYSPLPGPNAMLTAAPAASAMPEGSVLASVNAARSLENCLANCDEMDIRIIHGLLQGSSVEKIAEDLFISVGTARYRLKKLYGVANVTNKMEFMELFKRYINNDKIFDDFTGNFQESNI